jgi:hypothetical protein
MAKFYPQDGSIYRHRNGSEYRVLMVARLEATTEYCVVYEPREGGMAWVRPLNEFGDGRFTYVTNAE